MDTNILGFTYEVSHSFRTMKNSLNPPKLWFPGEKYLIIKLLEGLYWVLDDLGHVKYYTVFHYYWHINKTHKNFPLPICSLMEIVPTKTIFPIVSYNLSFIMNKKSILPSKVAYNQFLTRVQFCLQELKFHNSWKLYLFWNWKRYESLNSEGNK